MSAEESRLMILTLQGLREDIQGLREDMRLERVAVWTSIDDLKAFRWKTVGIASVLSFSAGIIAKIVF